MHSLTIPQHNDPIARIGLVGAALVLIWLAFAPSAQLAQPQAADAAAPIIFVATPTAALPTAPAAVVAQPAGGDQVTISAQSPQTEEPPASTLIHNADGSTTLPGVEDWMEPAPAVETQGTTAPNPLAVDPAVYQSLPVAGEPTASNLAPNAARRPHTGR